MPVFIKIGTAVENNPYTDVLVTFVENNIEHLLRGNFEGFEVAKDGSCKGFLKLSIKGKIIKLYPGDIVAEQFTEKFDKITRSNVRMIWDELISRNFTVEQVDK